MPRFTLTSLMATCSTPPPLTTPPFRMYLEPTILDNRCASHHRLSLHCSCLRSYLVSGECEVVQLGNGLKLDGAYTLLPCCQQYTLLTLFGGHGHTHCFASETSKSGNRKHIGSAKSSRCHQVMVAGVRTHAVSERQFKAALRAVAILVPASSHQDLVFVHIDTLNE